MKHLMKLDKEECNLRHFKRRMKERYDINTTKQVFEEISSQIKDGATFIRKQSDSRFVYDLVCDSKVIRVVYDKVRKTPITVLYGPWDRLSSGPKERKEVKIHLGDAYSDFKKTMKRIYNLNVSGQDHNEISGKIRNQGPHAIHVKHIYKISGRKSVFDVNHSSGKNIRVIYCNKKGKPVWALDKSVDLEDIVIVN